MLEEDARSRRTSLGLLETPLTRESFLEKLHWGIRAVALKTFIVVGREEPKAVKVDKERVIRLIL